MTLQANNLGLIRGGRPLFKALSFSLAPGGLLLLRGPNGAGKSSLLKLLAGLLPPTAGDIAWPDGERAKIRYVGHRDGLKAPLTVAENLEFLAVMEGGGHEANLDSLHLRPLLESPVSDLSAGQRRRTALARLVPGDGSLWLLDEPTTALDAAARDWLWQTVSVHRAAGGMIVAAVHDPEAPDDATVLTLGESP